MKAMKNVFILFLSFQHKSVPQKPFTSFAPNTHCMKYSHYFFRIIHYSPVEINFTMREKFKWYQKMNYKSYLSFI